MWRKFGGPIAMRGVHLFHDVDAVLPELFTRRRAQGRVQHSALFCGVDRLAVEHRLDVLVQAAVPCQLTQQRKRLVVSTVLRVIQIEPGGLDRPAGASLRVGGKNSRRCEPAM
jgi:hypothetical protein